MEFCKAKKAFCKSSVGFLNPGVQVARCRASDAELLKCAGIYLVAPRIDAKVTNTNL